MKTKKDKTDIVKLQLYVTEGLAKLWGEICKSPLYFNQQDAFRSIIREKAIEMGLKVDDIVKSEGNPDNNKEKI